MNLVFEAKAALRSCWEIGYIDFLVIQIGDKLFLHGMVESFYYKQLAQEAVRPVLNGVRLVNSIEVKSNICLRRQNF